MDIILRDIAFALARAAVATLLAKELYSVTIPTLVIVSIITYSALTQDPIRGSLPPFIGFKGIWDVIRGGRNRGDSRELVRFSILQRDVFWTSRGDVINELLKSARATPVFHANGIVIPYGDDEEIAVEKANFQRVFVANLQVFTSANLAMFYDVIDEEESFFIVKVSKAQAI